MTKYKTILMGAIVTAVVMASLIIQRQAQDKLGENETMLQQQNDRLVKLAAEHQRLALRLVQTKKAPDDGMVEELSKLRVEADTLRKQSNELGNMLMASHRSPLARSFTPDTSTGSDIASQVVSDSSSDEYKKQLYSMAAGTSGRKISDARNLSWSVRKYAREHQGEFPTNFEQAASYRYADQEPPQSSEFEMVYQGSLTELTNIAWDAVVLFRERLAWWTPGGKWGRIYVMAGGSPFVVESEDNFQSWEAARVIPPPSAGQK